MDEEKEKNKIEDLKKVLYSRNSKLPDTLILDLHKHKQGTETNWKEDTSKVFENIETPKQPKNFSLIIFMCASVFFVLSIFVAGFIYFRGDNIISPNNIAIDVVGPVTTPAGEPLMLEIALTNNNDMPLILADLLLEYPKGTRSTEDKVSSLTRERIPVGTIEPHQTVRKSISAILFDEEGKKPVIKYSLEYRLEDSGSVFIKDGKYEIAIGSSPVLMTVEMLKEINADQELAIDVVVKSNSKEITRDLILNVEFPAGFEMKSSTPEPFKNKTVWNLGDIEPEGERKIKIKGTVFGGESEEKYFKFAVGGQSAESEVIIDKPFLSLAKAVSIKKPFLGIDFAIAGAFKNSQVMRAGNTMSSHIDFQNNLSVPITDAEIEVRLGGQMMIERTVDAQAGFYRSSENVAKWTKFELPQLESIPPGKKSSVNLNYIVSGAFSGEVSGLKNQELTFDITIRGKRLSESNVPETIESTVKRKVRIETLSRLSTEVKHFTGPFKNEGPYPSIVDKKTDYTIVWTVTNSLNEVEGAKVTTTLPSYIVWNGKTSPTAEKMVYDPDSRRLTWEIGKILPGGGVSGSLRQVSFQVSVTPSLSQAGSAINLVNLATFEAHDTFTDTDISTTNNAARNILNSEAQYALGDEKVRE